MKRIKSFLSNMIVIPHFYHRATIRSTLVFVYIFSLIAYLKSQTQNEIFTKLIGTEVQMDSKATAKVLQSTPGTMFYVDSDNDGKIDVIYLIDNDKRHGDSRQPLLVKIVDEDGDMQFSLKGDKDSDLYIADWYSDGTIDRVIDYNDLDNDNDVDEQYLYGYRNDEYYVAWAKDYGDDNRLWYDINYEYNQSTTQWLTDFNGNEMFVYWFSYNYGNNTLTPCMENAFSFYDLDNDTYSEEAVRFSGTGTAAKDLRYSMDLDNDNRDNEPFHHDYDFSVSCIGNIDFPPERCMNIHIRNHLTEPIIKWEDMRTIAKTGLWTKVHLTWDENDNNITLIPGRQYYERWEGVINHSNEYMTQIGGPSCGPFNKRNEVDLDASGNMQFYYSNIDHRLHLYGAEVGWINVDYNYDEKIDMIIWMEDRNNNGFFDTWQYDINGDSIFEQTYEIDTETSEILPFEYKTLQTVYIDKLNEIVNENKLLIKIIKNLLVRIEKNYSIDHIEKYFETELINYGKDYHLGEKIKNSSEGTRYYYDLIRTSYWHRFKQTVFSQPAVFLEIEHAYKNGDFYKVTELINKYFYNEIFMISYGPKLFQNFPNPFNKITKIEYFLPQDAHVKVSIFNINGELVKILTDNYKNYGFNSILYNNKNLASSIYLYKMKMNEYSKFFKIILMK